MLLRMLYDDQAFSLLLNKKSSMKFRRKLKKIERLSCFSKTKNPSKRYPIKLLLITPVCLLQLSILPLSPKPLKMLPLKILPSKMFLTYLLSVRIINEILPPRTGPTKTRLVLMTMSCFGNVSLLTLRHMVRTSASRLKILLPMSLQKQTLPPATMTKLGTVFTAGLDLRWRISANRQ